MISPEMQSSKEPTIQDESMLCPGCLTPNDSRAHFCPNCGAPLDSYASSAPFERLLAQGYIFRRLGEKPGGLLGFLGVWSVFGVFALMGTSVLLVPADIGVPNYQSRIVGAVLSLISIAMLWQTTRRYFSRPKSSEEAES